jgi:8-oxo-dGTP diphosphatase
VHLKKTRKQTVRRRGTAIVDTPRGILVVAGKSGLYLLPGGGARRHESRRRAAIRELREETGLRTKRSKYLFSHDEPDDGRKIRNLHKIFLLETDGTARPTSHESRHIRFWNLGSDLKLSKTTRVIIDLYVNRNNQ